MLLSQGCKPLWPSGDSLPASRYFVWTLKNNRNWSLHVSKVITLIKHVLTAAIIVPSASKELAKHQTQFTFMSNVKMAFWHFKCAPFSREVKMKKRTAGFPFTLGVLIIAPSPSTPRRHFSVGPLIIKIFSDISLAENLCPLNPHFRSSAAGERKALSTAWEGHTAKSASRQFKI